MEKKVTEKQLIKAFDNYIEQLANNKKVSERKFRDMQTAIYGCKMLVKDAFGSPRTKEAAKSKA
jgi:hypothetical protein